MQGDVHWAELPWGAGGPNGGTWTLLYSSFCYTFDQSQDGGKWWEGKAESRDF